MIIKNCNNKFAIQPNCKPNCGISRSLKSALTLKAYFFVITSYVHTFVAQVGTVYYDNFARKYLK